MLGLLSTTLHLQALEKQSLSMIPNSQRSTFSPKLRGGWGGGGATNSTIFLAFESPKKGTPTFGPEILNPKPPPHLFTEQLGCLPCSSTPSDDP